MGPLEGPEQQQRMEQQQQQQQKCGLPPVLPPTSALAAEPAGEEEGVAGEVAGEHEERERGEEEVWRAEAESAAASKALPLRCALCSGIFSIWVFALLQDLPAAV